MFVFLDEFSFTWMEFMNDSYDLFVTELDRYINGTTGNAALVSRMFWLNFLHVKKKQRCDVHSCYGSVAHYSPNNARL